MRNQSHHILVQVIVLNHVIVVPLQYITRCVGQPQERVQRRVQSTTIDLNYYFIASSTLELEYVDITGLGDAAVDDLRQVDLLRAFYGVVGFAFFALRQSIQGIHNGIGKPFSPMKDCLADAIIAGFGIQR